MFGKLMSSLGLDGVKIDTRLAQAQVQAGQAIQGEIVFRGVNQDKLINRLDLKLMTRVEVERDDHEYQEDLCLAQWNISGSFRLDANRHINIPFNLQLPYEVPITQLSCHYNKSQVWLETHLDIDWAIDAHDRDMLQIVPTPAMTLFLNAMEQCGFRLAHADVEKGYLNGGYFRSTSGCYQELEFIPLQMMSSINEVEVSFVAEAHQTHVLLETDRRFRSRDQYSTLTLNHQQLDLATLVRQLRSMLKV